MTNIVPQDSINERAFRHICADGSEELFCSNENGDSRIKTYELSPGIRLTHRAEHTDHSFFDTSVNENVIEIHHCREGRMECLYRDGYLYLMPGDLAIELVSCDTKDFVFPLRHYHGITVSIDTAIAPKCFSCFLKDVNVQPMKVAKRLCGERPYFVIRSRDYIEHIFSEMYSVPCKNKIGYYKIKLLELFLVLSGIDPDENSLNNRTVSASQVELAKGAAAFISDNTDRHISVASLSQRFHVSATYLQNTFKGVFGVPVYSYARINKMNLAALRLIRTDKTVMEIAGELGYDNAGKFAAAFRDVMNESPLQYRKSHSPSNTEQCSDLP